MELVEKLKNKENLQLGKGYIAENAADAVEYLDNHKMPALPEDYLELLQDVNGAYSFTAELYGLNPDEENYIKDVVLSNVRQERADADSVFVLGANEFDFLVYDAKDKVYQMRDRQSDEIIYSFSNLDNAVTYLFNL